MSTDRLSLRWTPQEDAKIVRLREGPGDLSWDDIAKEMPGRSSGACEQRYYGKLGKARGKKGRRRRGPKPSMPRVLWRAPKPRASAPQAPERPVGVPALRPQPVAEPARRPNLEGLREHAELRLRIAERGLTGGVFGDPPPGRSALDQRASARAAPLQPSLAGEGSDGR